MAVPLGRPTAEDDPVAKQKATDDHDSKIDGFKGIVVGAGKGLDDMFSAETVYGYNPNAQNFNLGGQAGFANQRAGSLGASGAQIATDLRRRGSQGLAGQQQQAGQFLQQGQNVAGQQQELANQYGQQGQAGNALQQARALGYGQQAAGALGAAQAQQGSLQNHAIQQQGNATHDYNTFADNSWAAGRRQGVGVMNEGQTLQDRDLESQGRAQQLAAANALGYQAQANYGQGATQDLRNFASQTGNGPSAAQAQMQQGADQSMASSLALARSGRGNNTGAVRQAMFQNAATQGQTNQQLGTLRAQETDQAQNRELGALSAASSAQQNYRGQDLNALQGAAGVLGQARGQDQSQQQIGIGQGQYDANLALQNRQLNDATALGWAGQQQQAAQRGDQSYLAAQGLGQQAVSQGQNYALGLQGLGQQASTAGQQYDLGKGQLANQALGQGQQFQLGSGQLANQASGQGLNYDLGAQGQANQTWLGAQAQAGQTLGQQLQGDMSYEQLQAQQYLAAQQSNQQADTERDKANTGMVTGLLGGLMMSDEHSKKQITSLKGQLADAMALGFKPEAPDTDALDDAYRRQGGEPRVDLRGSPGYSYQYKDPNAPGAAPGTHVGPMAQDLEKSPATAGSVVTGPDGVKRVDPGRLTLTNTAAISDQQRDIQAIKQALATNNQKPGYDRDALDEAYERDGGRVTKPGGWRDQDPLGDQYASSNWRYQPGF